MGYNTTVLILNDGFDQVQKYADQFVTGIRDQMHNGGTVSVGNHCNVVEVMPTQHADAFRLYATHQNSIVELSPYNRDTMALARRMPDLLRDYIRKAKAELRYLEHELRQIHAGTPTKPEDER